MGIRRAVRSLFSADAREYHDVHNSSILKTYELFDNLPGTTVYGALVGNWTWIGAGRNGHVYRVTGAGGKSVVVKMSHESRLADQEAVSSLREHLQTVMQIGARYAVRHLGVYWGGGPDFDGRGKKLPGGSQYGVVMEDGGVALDQYLEEQVLSYRERVHLAVGLAEAVEELHRLDLVHRDLKPSNVL